MCVCVCVGNESGGEVVKSGVRGTPAGKDK